MTTKNLLTQSLLKEYLNYNPKTGIFTWIKNTHKFKNLIGKKAGSVSKRDSHVEIRLLGTLYRANRLAWLFMTGENPKNFIDHINHNEQDNTWKNLRDVTSKENNRNLSKKKTNTSGVTGVWLRKYPSGTTKYIAEIMVNKKKVSLGSFNTLAEAKKVRKIAEIEYGFHLNHGIDKPNM